MRMFSVSFLIIVLVSVLSAQTHQKALEDFTKLKQKAEAQKESLNKESEKLEKIILQPDKKDILVSDRVSADVFRILPREIYDKDVFKVRGGGAYYSFTKQSHSYDAIPQISLEQNNLKVGFAGANYGFIVDLGEISFDEIKKKHPEVNFLVNYKPPANLSDVRIEQRKAKNHEVNGISYKDHVPVVVGHMYLCRAISFGEADVLVALKIYRKDADGSLIIFWRMMENFEKPVLARN